VGCLDNETSDEQLARMRYEARERDDKERHYTDNQWAKATAMMWLLDAQELQQFLPSVRHNRHATNYGVIVVTPRIDYRFPEDRIWKLIEMHNKYLENEKRKLI
jgi:hypothetical protein